jgi:hypothetical protein
MIDTEALRKNIDLRQTIEKISGATGGNTKRLYCPICQVGKRTVPALSIRDDYYFCFGCGAKGDAIDLIQALHHLSFIEACKYLGWDGCPGNDADIEKIKAERIIGQEVAEQQRLAQLDAMLAEFSADEIWMAYQRRLDEDSRQWWRNQGVPDDWQNYLRLGYTNDKAYYDKGGSLCHSPAFTIPYFHSGWDFQNMQYRLVDPANPKDRYRFQPGLRTTYYVTTPSEPMQDCAVICEGAKKAMVANIMGDTGDKVSVLAVPSKTDSGGVAEAVKDCRHVWIVLDPDAWDRPANAGSDWLPAPVKLAQQIGKAARVVRLPAKSDDMFLQYGMSCDEWKSALKAAGRAG